MDTKSKSTNIFRGVVSWLCMMLTFGVLAMGVVGLISCAIWMCSSDADVVRELVTSLAAPSQNEAYARLYNVLVPAGIAAGLLAGALTLVFLFRQDRKEVEAAIAVWLGKLWVEAKLILLFLFAFLAAEIVFESVAYHDFYSSVSATLSIGLAAYILLLLLYFLSLDIGHNRRFFAHNIIHTILTRINSYKGLPRFEKRSLRRFYSCAAVILGVLLFGVLLLFCMDDLLFYRPVLFFGFCLSIATAVVGTYLWYVISLKQDLRDWNALMDQIREMYEGNMEAVNHVPPASTLYDCAMQLNMIRIGIQKAVEEGIKADRTKVELITNVSHDIKTPLTSIISYIGLLQKEPDLPPHVQDYINTIAAKADRLSHIVQDVFEVSKAATGNINLDLEDLDIGKLLQQTFGEMDQIVSQAPLTWRVEIPETPVIVHADGQRLYRVFQNLIRNCAQYSLEGSRAYVKLFTQNGMATVSIRNVSKTEILMDEEDLTARFVRGDQNRTTEGSGLGLSIAKSFTEACGGSFSVRTDGDLFTVTASFPLVAPPPQPLQLELYPQQEGLQAP